MLKSDLLHEMNIEKYGEMKDTTFLTDVIVDRLNILYGASGVGKTQSVVKNLNRYNLKPLLIDFDKNENLKGDFNVIYGEYFYRGFTSMLNKDDAKKQMADKLNKAQIELNTYIAECYEFIKITVNFKMKFEGKKLDYFLKDYEEADELFKYHQEQKKVFTKLLIEYYNIYNSIDNANINTDNPFHIRNEIVMIDTCAKAIEVMGSFETFKKMIKDLRDLDNTVILIAHSKYVGVKQYPDLDDEFCNHCDSRLQLNKDITKTKKTDSYLVVEKLRGYKGEDKIFNWERE